MLTEKFLKQLKSKEKTYKVADRDGLYVHVAISGTVTFRYDYRINGQRETLVIGKYGRGGVSLLAAREQCLDARRLVVKGESPALEKRRAKRKIKEATSFGQFGRKWLEDGRMADSTRKMRGTIFKDDISPAFECRLLKEIKPDDLRQLCAKVKDRGAPATAVHVRDIVKQIFSYAILHGEQIQNPADEVGPSSIATFVPRDRVLSPTDIRVILMMLEQVPTLPTIRLGLRLIFLTMVRKSELQGAVWDGWILRTQCGAFLKAHKTIEATQYLSIPSVIGHINCTEDLFGKFQISIAVTNLSEVLAAR